MEIDLWVWFAVVAGFTTPCAPSEWVVSAATSPRPFVLLARAGDSAHLVESRWKGRAVGYMHKHTHAVRTVATPPAIWSRPWLLKMTTYPRVT
jgi:hypothetical protein